MVSKSFRRGERRQYKDRNEGRTELKQHHSGWRHGRGKWNPKKPFKEKKTSVRKQNQVT